MSEAKHTEGPWEYRPDGDVMVFGGDGEPLMTRIRPSGHRRPDDEREANARLCAAAPDRLAACEAVLAADDHDGVQLAYDMARRAVARAKGEGG